MKDLVFVSLLCEHLGGWSELSGASTCPACCYTMCSLCLGVRGGSIYILGRITKGTKRSRAKGLWVPSPTGESWLQQSDTLPCVPASGSSSVAGPAGRGGWDLYSRGLTPTQKLFPYGKRGELLSGNSQQSLAQLLSLLFQLSCLENKRCDLTNFLKKILKNTGFLKLLE